MYAKLDILVGLLNSSYSRGITKARPYIFSKGGLIISLKLEQKKNSRQDTLQPIPIVINADFFLSLQ